MACLRAIPRSWCLSVLALAASAVLAPSAHAAFSVVPTLLSPSSLTAGAHQDLQLRIALPQSGVDARDLDVKLPPGLVGDPNAVTLCTIAQADAKNCPAASQVGTVVAIADTIAHNSPLFGADVPINDMETPGTIHMMEPRGDEPARMFIKLNPDNPLASITPITMENPLKLRSPGDYGLTTEIRNMPRTTNLWYYGLFDGGYGATASVHVKSMTMTLKGTPPNSPHGPYLTNPTSCDPVRFEASASAYGSTDWVDGMSEEIPVTGCESVPFTPSLAISPSTVTADQPTGVSVTIGFPDPDSGLGQSTLKRTEVVLPEGFALSASSGSQGMAGCSDEAFAPDSPAAPDCGEAAKIGTVAFTTPLIGTINGDVYVGEGTPDAPLQMRIYATLGSITLKLSGRAVPDPATGRLTTIFDRIPPVPFTSFTMTFRDGPNAILKAPSVCGTQQAVAHMTPAAAPDTVVDATATVTTGDCVTPGFAPTLSAEVSSTQAGADTGMTLQFSRTDSDDRFDSLRASMPPGLLGRLTAVQACPLADAQAGHCDDSAKVGTVSVVAGTGPDPLPLSGDVFLTTPPEGAVAGLGIVLRAKVGPVDLGTTTVISKMTVRDDMGINVSTDAMPRIVGGVPLFLRSMTMRLDREGFMFNASSCTPRTIDATLTSFGGASVSTSSPYAPTGCDQLPFEPGFKAVLGAPATAPSMTATMTARAGDATLSGMSMTLPRGLAADMTKLGNTCSEDAFRAGSCPAKSRIGSATALSAVLPDALSGPVYFVKRPEELLPALMVTLRGPVDVPLTIVNTIGEQNRLVSTVTDVPDVPMTSFQLKLDAGALLQGDRGLLCGKQAPQMSAVFTSHSGAQSKASPAVSVDCSDPKILAPGARVKATASLRRAGRGAALRVTVRGRQLTSARITLPAALTPQRARLRSAALLKAGGRLLNRKQVSARGRQLTITLPAVQRAKGVSSLSLDLAPQAFRARGLRRGKAVVLKVRGTHVGGGVSTTTVRVKPR